MSSSLAWLPKYFSYSEEVFLYEAQYLTHYEIIIFSAINFFSFILKLIFFVFWKKFLFTQKPINYHYLGLYHCST